MSYNHPYQPGSVGGDGYPGADYHRSGSNDNGRSPHSQSPPSAQLVVPQASRSSSATRTSASAGQAQLIDPSGYVTGQNWPQDRGYAHFAQPYTGSQSQSQLPSSPIPIQGQAYHSTDQYRPPDHPPSQHPSHYGQPRRSVSQSRSVPQDSSTQSGHFQQPQYTYGGQEYPSRSQQQQPQAPSHSYPQQQSPTYFPQQQHSSTQAPYQQQPHPSTQYQQHWEQQTNSGYYQSQQGQYPTRTSDYNISGPLSPPVGVPGLVRCPQCEMMYSPHVRNGSGQRSLPPCPSCGYSAYSSFA